MTALDERIGLTTAYGYAKSKGYTGTEEEFAQAMANAGITLESITEAVDAFINTTVPSAVQSVTTEGNTQVTRVTDTGTAQVNAVNTAGGTNVSAVNSAGATQVQAVNTAGSTQVGNVNTAGTTQVTNINNAGATQITAIQTKGEQTRATIPEDYTALSDSVEGLKSSVSDIQDIVGSDKTYRDQYSHGTAIYAQNYSIPVQVNQGQTVIVSVSDANNPAKTFLVYAEPSGSTSLSNIGRVTEGSSFTFVASAELDAIGFYAEGMTSGVLETTIIVKSDKTIADEINGKVDKSGTGQVTTRNLIDVTSNVLYAADSVTVSGTSTYVNKVIANYSGPFNVGDVFTISASSVEGATVETNSPYAIHLKNANNADIRSKQYPDIEITQADIDAGVVRIDFILYPAKGTAMPTGSATYYDVEVLKGLEAEYNTTGALYKAIKSTVDNVYEAIPDYYFENDYLDNKASRISEIAQTCAGNGDVFAFITDEHFDFGYNQKHSPDLIAYLDSKVNIPRLFNGGDTANGLSIEFVDDLKNLYPHRIHHVMGNHDWMLNRSGDYLAYYCDSFAYNQVGYADKHYYYVDNEQKKIRYIVLNTWKSDLSQNNVLVTAYDQEQLQWFTNVALDVESGWGIIIFTHYIKVGTNIAPDGALAFLNAIDNYSGNGEVICIVEGHTHFDSISHTNGGIPIINTTSDKNGVWYDGDTPMDGWLAERVSGTVYEQAFDVMCVNRTERKITAIRIGGLAMDNVDKTFGQSGFTTTGTLEERVITY